MTDSPIAESTEATISPAVEQPTSAFINLYAGNELNSEEAAAVTLRSPAHLVVFAGAAESGKTTILGTIYERLNEEPFAGFQFAGSRSLLGFEQVCHLNRVASSGARPETPRTVPADEAVYYHLSLRATEPAGPRRDVLLSAISGELYQLAKNSREDCEQLTFLRRANTIVILVDGARLSVPAQRMNAQSEASSILESFLDANMIGSRCRVEFVFSKLDLVLRAGDSAREFVNVTQRKFDGRFGKRLPHLAFRRIAARPEVGPGGETISDDFEEAFVSWITPKSGGENAWDLAVVPKDAREFAKYGWRYSAMRAQ